MRNAGILPAMAEMAEDERGNIAAIVGVLMTVFVGSGAVMVDLGRAHALRADLEATADAAALAAAARLPDTKRARAAAVDYARKNMPVAEYGDVLRLEDIVFGAWDPQARARHKKGSQCSPSDGPHRRAQRQRSADDARRHLGCG
jgi:Flp pilus assembly protein TadG